MNIITLTALAFALSCDSTKKWAAKIDNEVISIDEFEHYYYTQNKLTLNLKTNKDVDKLEKELIDKMSSDPKSVNPQLAQMLLKENYLDAMIFQRQIYKKATTDKDIDQKELQAILEMQKLQATYAYYIKKKFGDDFTVTDAEAEKFYQQNQKYFKGVPINDKVIQKIKQQIQMQKMRIKTQQYRLELLAQSKINKEGLKSYLKKKSNKKEDKKIETKNDKKPADTKKTDKK